MGRVILALFVAVVAACDPPSLPPTGESYVIAFEEDTPGAPTAWRAEHRRTLSVLTAILGRTGASFRFGTSREADVVLRTFDSGARCTHGGGYYEIGSSDVFIDYACADGEEGLVWITAHECGHWLEYRRNGVVHHLCLHPGDATDCYPGVNGEGVMNPWTPDALDDDGNPLGRPPPVFTENDLIVLAPASAR